jgi:multidrug efflux pump subunit AcrA (membrane-fusion protein)
MPKLVGFLLKHWLTLLLLALSIAAVRWIVENKRPPGAMTVIEAQAMDMTQMKAPPGVQPVAAEAASRRLIGGMETFPASIVAYNDEDVTARVQGRVSAVLVYPGDKVARGQLLATLEAEELSAQHHQSIKVSAAELTMANASQRAARQAQFARQRAAAEVEAAEANLERERAMVESSEAMVADRQAEARYAEAEFQRMQKMHAAGAVSLDELQAAETMNASAQAKLNAAKADLRVAMRSATAAQRMLAIAQKAALESDEEVARAGLEAVAKQELADAARNEARSASILAGYRQLRALNSGVVSERLVSPGTLVMPGQIILKIKNSSRVRVQAQLPERLAPKVKVGSSVEIVAGDMRKHAAITSLAGAVNSDTRTFMAEAIVPNSDGRLLAGMFAKMRVQLARPQEVLSIRNSAVRSAPDGSAFVWVMEEKKESAPASQTDWTCTMHPEVSRPGPGSCPICKMDLVPRSRSGKFIAVRKPVKLGIPDDTFTPIISGLKEGEMVIWAGHEDLYQNAPVQAVAWGETGPQTLPSGTGEMSGHTEHKMVTPPPPKRTKPRLPSPPAATQYQCPMHPEVSSDKPGTCSKCKMDLEKKK